MIPPRLAAAIRNGEEIHAHNAGFEKAIWQHQCMGKLGWPAIPEGQWRCSMAACSRLGLPRSLEETGKALGLKVQKDKEGHRIMMRLCRPKKPSKVNPSEWDNNSAKLQKLYAYCVQDVEAEAELIEAIEPLTAPELKCWQLSQDINRRGIPVDIEGIVQARKLIARAKTDADKRLAEITGDEVTAATQAGRILKWLQDQGVEITNLRAETVRELLHPDYKNGDPMNMLTPEVKKLS